jgi:hypothetical protein
LLTSLIANGNLVLEGIKPTLMITGSGGANTAANTITFNFSKAIKDGSFTVDDIGIVNGTINSGSFTKVSETQYTVMVTPNLGGKHSNVAITVAANSFTDVTGNTNTTIAKNTTKISNLKELIDINTDLTHWDVSYVSDASRAFCVMKHRLHINHFTNIPTANILVKDISVPKHPMHVSHLANIPAT